MTRVFESLPEWRGFRQSPEFAGKALGFVPTMGALHAGHLALVERSRRENDRTVVSIFVNPTQFNDPKDLEKYPRTLEADLELLSRAGADYLIFPTYEALYPEGYRYRMSESEESTLLCGAHRPGHFDGVLTVVLKLLQLTQARRAYFGEKDYQQLRLVRGMADAFFLPTEIVPCPIVREPDGLAMSSRNTRLSQEARQQAAIFPELLRSGRSPGEIRAQLEQRGFKVDYIEERWGRRLGAVWVGGVRLIDNVEAR